MKRELPDITSIGELVKLAEAGIEHRGWYVTAKAQIYAAAAILDVTPKRFADLLALFSPRVSVKRNIRFTVQYIRDGTYAHDVMKTIRIGVEHYEQTGEIRGPKTSKFARAIMGDRSAIVLDTWMSVALGIEQKRFDGKYVRDECENRIQTVTIIMRRQYVGIDLQPADIQAAIWSATVKAAGRNVPEFLILPEIYDESE